MMVTMFKISSAEDGVEMCLLVGKWITLSATKAILRFLQTMQIQASKQFINTVMIYH